jgi:hypothetical protein
LTDDLRRSSSSFGRSKVARATPHASFNTVRTTLLRRPWLEFEADARHIFISPREMIATAAAHVRQRRNFASAHQDRIEPISQRFHHCPKHSYGHFAISMFLRDIDFEFHFRAGY